jgi:hypothetical protein
LLTRIVIRNRNWKKKHTITGDRHDGPSPALSVVLPLLPPFAAVSVGRWRDGGLPGRKEGGDVTDHISDRRA